jgi:ABC-2 type transport system permease protein
MRKIFSSIKKESLILLRDIEGILLIFLMPLLLVVILTLLQHRTFQSINETKIPIIVADFDNDSLGSAFRNGIKKSSMFEVTEITEYDSSLLERARQDVATGKYQIGILIPPGSTQKIKNRAISLIQQQLPYAVKSNALDSKQTTVQLFFDPITKTSFRNIVKGTLTEFAAKTESVIIFQAYSKVIDALTNQSSNIAYPDESIIAFNEDLVSEYTAGIIPNAVQHNVPAWTLFGMFLICIPIAGNIIKERNDGCLARLKTVPVKFTTIIIGKSFVFVVICMVQAILIVLVGLYLMPVIGMPKLQINGNWGALFAISLASSFSATGYGILIGNIASTQIQASTFGSISTVILAAIGGVWIPVIIMPNIMRRISEISPMNWGIQGYYDVFLRNSSTLEILPSVLKLIGFYIACAAISLVFRKHQIKN